MDETAYGPARKRPSLCENARKRPITSKGLPDRSVVRQRIVIASAPLLALTAHGELLPAFCPPAVDDLAAVLRRHAGSESVCIASLALVRLKSAFHCLLCCSYSSRIFESTHFLPYIQPPISHCERSFSGSILFYARFVIFSLAFTLSR